MKCSMRTTRYSSIMQQQISENIEGSRNTVSEIRIKVERKEMNFLFAEIESLARDPVALEELYLELASGAIAV